MSPFLHGMEQEHQPLASVHDLTGAELLPPDGRKGTVSPEIRVWLQVHCVTETTLGPDEV